MPNGLRHEEYWCPLLTSGVKMIKIQNLITRVRHLDYWIFDIVWDFGIWRLEIPIGIRGMSMGPCSGKCLPDKEGKDEGYHS